MSQLKQQIDEIEAEMENLQRQVLEATQPYEQYLIMSGKYRGLKSVRDRLKDKLQKRSVPDDPEIDELSTDKPAPAARIKRKARTW